MASPTAVARRIDRSLHAQLAESRVLARTAEEWDTLLDGERTAIALDWDHLLVDNLTELERWYLEFRRNARSPCACGAAPANYRCEWGVGPHTP